MSGSIFPVQLDDVCVRRRGARILGPVSVEIGGSGLTAILGPNGSGKTTFLRVLHGLERLSAGRLQWQIATREAQSRQAYVFQTPIMMRRSVRDNLAYPLQLLGVSKSEVSAACETWADRIGLSDALERSATRLSGGEKQKLALARGLIRRPEVLFLDEPSTNLDGRATREIEALLRDALEAGTRIIMATHDLGQARRLASDVHFLLTGRIQTSAPAEAFFDAPSTPEAAAFLKGDIVE
ncbi:MAG: ATP-binding cassette domain-containing protein [Pseudomonadota bacterium]